jgi:CheY-like chemotaxis protein
MCVLLVEDDTILRMTMLDFLEATGLQILEAKDADEARVILADPSHHVLILVTDLNLGVGDDGLVLAAQARKYLPELEVIYATGSPEMLRNRLVASWEQVFLKPFNPQTLTQAVSALHTALIERSDLPSCCLPTVHTKPFTDAGHGYV